MKLNLLTNRVVIGLVLFLVLVGVYQFRWKPHYRPYYENAVRFYQGGDYLQSLRELEQAYDIAPNSLDVIVLMGWTQFKLGNYERADYFFQRALTLDPRTEEARLGAAFVALETGKGEIDTDLLEKLLAERSSDPNARILKAGALAGAGRHFEAAEIYRGLLDDRSYGEAAQAALEQMFGLQGFDDPVPQSLPPFRRPGERQVPYRASENALWEQERGEWKKYYLAGVNLSPGIPGYYSAAPPNDGRLYLNWLQQISAMNANVVRVQRLLPPSFYRALSHHNARGQRVKLFQQIWLMPPPNDDLFDAEYTEATKTRIRDVVDAIHGRGSLPLDTRRQQGGVYSVDVSNFVAAILLGGELDAGTVLQTNLRNLGKRSHQGRFVRLADGKPSEVWLVQMLDYMMEYETETYNTQRPVAFANRPSLDPLVHPSENTGTRNDLVSIDEAKFQRGPENAAGIFAAYSVYPYYPDFLLDEPGLVRARDSQGPNPLYGYLEELKQHLPHPLVVLEYGIPSSIGIARFHPFGWNQGGHTEQEQARILTRMASTVREAGCAGGFVYELFDEWYKTNWLTRDFQVPADRSTLWLNDLAPEQRFGLVGFRTSRWKLFSASDEAWSNEKVLYRAQEAMGAKFDPAKNVRLVQAASDEGYLYLRLKLACATCDVSGQKSNARDTEGLAYALALSTVSGRVGLQRLPFGNVSLPTGANFLLYLDKPEDSKLLIASNYYPHAMEPKPGSPERVEFQRRRVFTPRLEEHGAFISMEVETREPRYGRNQVFYPGQRYDRSLLRYGNGDPGAGDYDSLAEWFVYPSTNSIVVRIPWGKLLITDPSGLRAFYGFTEQLAPLATSTPGVDVAVFTLQTTGVPDLLTDDLLLSSMPPVSGARVEEPKRYTWDLWNTVKPEVYYKRAYYALQKEFAQEASPERAVAGSAGAGRQPAGAGRTGSR